MWAIPPLNAALRGCLGWSCSAWGGGGGFWSVAGAQGGCRDLQSVVLPLESCVFLGERPWELCSPASLLASSPACAGLEQALPGAGMMQELLTGMEKIKFDSEGDVEELGTHPLPFPGVDSVQGQPQHGGAQPAVCKLWLRGLCKRGDGCDFLHDGGGTPECYFYSRLGECSDKDCPFLHAAATAAGPVRCPWYDRGFCRHGPLCKYKHTRRKICANYLVGFCPEGPKCQFAHLKARLMTSTTDPSKEAACPQGLAQRDLAAAEERAGEDVPPKEPPPCGTQHLAAHLRDTSGCPLSPQSLLEGGTCSKSGSATESGRTALEMQLGK
uniref:Cleavage and polyadenylation specificity factor subunit 4 n=1 Tax=Cyanoderma ruficeps TaxID=181631 RepID=A0A8C3QUC9_9PASS